MRVGWWIAYGHYERHAIEKPPERVRENVAAQPRDSDGYNVRPISGA
jgi:hypothetical protein